LKNTYDYERNASRMKEDASRMKEDETSFVYFFASVKYTKINK